MKDINFATDNTKKISKQEVSPQERHAMIEKAAYYGACSRGFGKSDVISDWLFAEKQVDFVLEGE